MFLKWWFILGLMALCSGHGSERIWRGGGGHFVHASLAGAPCGGGAAGLRWRQDLEAAWLFGKQ